MHAIFLIILIQFHSRVKLIDSRCILRMKRKKTDYTRIVLQWGACLHPMKGRDREQDRAREVCIDRESDRERVRERGGRVCVWYGEREIELKKKFFFQEMDPVCFLFTLTKAGENPWHQQLDFFGLSNPLHYCNPPDIHPRSSNIHSCWRQNDRFLNRLPTLLCQPVPFLCWQNSKVNQTCYSCLHSWIRTTHRTLDKQTDGCF